jgi:hypothetical protein
MEATRQTQRRFLRLLKGLGRRCGTTTRWRIAAPCEGEQMRRPVPRRHAGCRCCARSDAGHYWLQLETATAELKPGLEPEPEPEPDAAEEAAPDIEHHKTVLRDSRPRLANCLLQPELQQLMVVERKLQLHARAQRHLRRPGDATTCIVENVLAGNWRCDWCSKPHSWPHLPQTPDTGVHCRESAPR